MGLSSLFSATVSHNRGRLLVPASEKHYSRPARETKFTQIGVQEISRASICLLTP
jgi:hypothetical protein